MKLLALLVILISAMHALYAEGSAVPRFDDPSRRSRLEAALPEIERLFERFYHESGAPGLAFGVVLDGDLVLVKGFGVRDRQSQDAVTPDTVFRIASMTKSFTALAILKLRDEGKLSLDDLASKWIPELAKLGFPTRDSAPIRIRTLLTHGAGFPEDNPWGDRQLAVTDETLTRWLQRGLPFSTSPDTEYEYSNYGFGLLGRIVAKASGMSYRDYLERNILAALGMQASTLEPTAVPPGNRATGYGRSGEGLVEIPSLGHGAFGSMGGLMVSARDLARYVAYQLSAYPPRDEQERGPVRRSSQREMQRAWRSAGLSVTRATPAVPIRAVSTGYGYGLSVAQTCRFAHLVSHGGGLPGFGSFMAWLPEYGVGMFGMTNLTYTAPARAINEAFDVFVTTGALDPRRLPPPPALTSMRDAIVRFWKHSNENQVGGVFADNFFLDAGPGTRRKLIESLKTDMGECPKVGEVLPENLLRGTFRMSCEHGFVDAYFTLAPTVPPRLQQLRFTAATKLDSSAASAAAALASLIGSPSPDRLGALAAQSVNIAELERQLAALHAEYGTCRTGETLAGNGRSTVRVKFECDRGTLDTSLELAADGKLRQASFNPPAGAVCVP